MGVQSWLTVSATIFGIAGLAGVAYAVLRSSLTRTTAQLYKETNEALTKRLDELKQELADERSARERDVARLAAESDACEKRFESLEIAYRTLIATIGSDGQKRVNRIREAKPRPTRKKKP